LLKEKVAAGSGLEGLGVLKKEKGPTRERDQTNRGKKTGRKLRDTSQGGRDKRLHMVEMKK